MELMVLGKVIGDCDGWDENETCVIQVYDFEPVSDIEMEAGSCVIIDFSKGEFQYINDEGDVDTTLKILDVLKPS